MAYMRFFIYGIKLIEVWENDWKKNNQQIKDLISKHLQI